MTTKLSKWYKMAHISDQTTNSYAYQLQD